MLKCRDLVHDADALLHGDLPLRRRLALQLHLFMCVHCRRYLRQLRLMVAVLQRRKEPASQQEVEQVLASVRRSERD